jgi:hypothetical protein
VSDQCFKWTFLQAEVRMAILGIDFLRAFKLSVDPAAGSLVPGTGLTLCTISLSSGPTASAIVSKLTLVLLGRWPYLQSITHQLFLVLMARQFLHQQLFLGIMVGWPLHLQLVLVLMARWSLLLLLQQSAVDSRRPPMANPHGQLS